MRTANVADMTLQKIENFTRNGYNTIRSITGWPDRLVYAVTRERHGIARTRTVHLLLDGTREYFSSQDKVAP